MRKTVIDAERNKWLVNFYKTLPQQELSILNTYLSVGIKKYKRELKLLISEVETKEAMLSCVKRAQKYLERKEQNGEDVKV